MTHRHHHTTATRKKWKKQVWSAGGRVCFYCGCKLSFDQATIDHFTPLSKGGDDKPHNMVAACWPCNKHKSDSLGREFIRMAKHALPVSQADARVI